MSRLYEVWISPEIVQAEHQAKPSSYYSNFADEIQDILYTFFSGSLPRDLSFLDFGMGWGQWALMAKAHGIQAFGTELSRDQVENAQALGIHVVPYEEIPGSKFDFINTEQVFEHLAEPLVTLRHLKRGLSPGGILKISVPHAADIRRTLEVMDWNASIDSPDSLNPVAPLEHLNFFERESILKMASECGLREIALRSERRPRRSSTGVGFLATAKSALRPAYRYLRPLPQGNQIFLKNG